MRLLIAILAVISVLLQIKLWAGDGSLRDAWELKRAVETQQRENAELRQRNLALEAEVRDLKTGLDAIEERARLELGMIHDSEIFYQIVEPAAPAEELMNAKK